MRQHGTGIDLGQFTVAERRAVRAWQDIPPMGGRTSLLWELRVQENVFHLAVFESRLKSVIVLTEPQAAAARAFLQLPPTQRRRVVGKLIELEEGNA